MNRTPKEESAADRALWLAELAEALAESKRMTRDLQLRGVAGADSLMARITAAEREIESLRLRRGGEDIDPKWMENLPWARHA